MQATDSLNLPENFQRVQVFLLPNHTGDGDEQVTQSLHNFERVWLVLHSLVLFFLGIPGLTLTICILRRRGDRDWQQSPYFVASSVFAMILVMLVSSKFFYMGAFEDDYRSWNYDLCLAHRLTVMVCSACGNWVVVFVTYSRYYCIQHPYRTDLAFQRRGVSRVIIATVLCVSVTEAVMVGKLLVMHTHPENYHFYRGCFIDSPRNNWLFHFHQAVTYTPYPLLVVLSCMLLYEYWQQSRHQRLHLSDLPSTETLTRIASDQLMARVSLLGNLDFLALTSPHLFVDFFVSRDLRELTSIRQEFAFIKVEFASLLSLGGYVSYPLIYCIFGRNFHAEVMRLLTSVTSIFTGERKQRPGRNSSRGKFSGRTSSRGPYSGRTSSRGQCPGRTSSRGQYPPAVVSNSASHSIDEDSPRTKVSRGSNHQQPRTKLSQQNRLSSLLSRL